PAAFIAQAFTGMNTSTALDNCTGACGCPPRRSMEYSLPSLSKNTFAWPSVVTVRDAASHAVASEKTRWEACQTMPLPCTRRTFCTATDGLAGSQTRTYWWLESVATNSASRKADSAAGGGGGGTG